jgi:hypothetical protein
VTGCHLTEEKKSLQSEHMKRNRYLIVIALIVAGLAFPIYGYYQRSNEPVSFIANNIHFTNNGTIEIQANITNLSVPALIQVDAAIDGSDNGICDYDIATNQTMMYMFTNPNPGPLVSCAQLPEVPNHTLTLNAIFGNGKGYGLHILSNHECSTGV